MSSHEHPVFEIIPPRVKAVPVIASIPHSGLYVPSTIAAQFTPEHLAWLRNTDWFIPEVFSFLPDLGVTTITATHSRYVVDLNRDASGELYGPFGRTPVAQTLLSGQQTHTTHPGNDELTERIRLYHEPFHQALGKLLTETVARFGSCLLIDLHAFMGPSDNDICLGNLHGVSSHVATINNLQNILVSEGFTTSVNDPFSGVYILRRHYGQQVEAMQFELRYTNYMDCKHIDEPGRPVLDKGMLTALQPRLIRAFNQFLQP
ncbi:N-formylglutamate amidohydrolase [Dickeya dadantii]|uniref:N-formylglutamate amidohydrolase n=1 Tax=Dickeya dadantii TaxID=204038 RepID=UPI001C0B1A4F|nr:N-formylglutamate amidohydrolase [Dickeya dadantii]QWT40043.1 N-formylglutamate amidohydrolase [Dickeya dadantii]